jgi:hypothetical protein
MTLFVAPIGNKRNYSCEKILILKPYPVSLHECGADAFISGKKTVNK